MISEESQKEIALIAKLTDLEKFCLDATIISNLKSTEKVLTAYRLSRPKESKANEQAIYTLARRWYKLPQCQAYLKMKKEYVIMSSEEEEEGKVKSNRTKEEIVAILNKHLTRADNAGDSKLVNDIAARLNDVQLKKEVSTQEEQIKYYLPLQCSKCDLYLHAKMSQNQ